MQIDPKLNEALTNANLYFLLAKKYEYVDPKKHMYFYQKHFYYAEMVDKLYMQMEENMAQQYNAIPNNYNTMY
ncbi:hypothetical protein [Virgibacillus litoralis]|uniref:Spore coat protein n=1 Tax=Virgibacillus litoralis TaxID=578221 RepID=A0ABS4HCK3_9BACI|nr:hypothetical protein [Virgibacillus litoralis]MBP1948645.1 hypothetical protein [Virgibacillus litoralis]